MQAPATCAFGSAMFNLPVRLDGLLRHGYMLPKGAEKEIPLIKRDVEEIIAIILKLEDDHATMVRCWTKEVRELSYDIEDFVDQYEHAAADSGTRSISARGNKVITRWRRRKTATPPWCHEKLRKRLWMASKIREFSVRVQEVLQRHHTYNLGAIARTNSTRCTDASSSSWRLEAHVGISGTMNELEELLMTAHDGEQQKLKVVSVVGFGGVGKTTLASELYHKLERQYECGAFVRTSQKPDMRRLFISMLSQVRPHHTPDNWKVHNLISSIRTHLQDKRYLIIIDDLWSTSTWDIIKCALPDGNSCSRILTMTEIEDIALHSCGYNSKYVFKMKPLGEDASRELFFSSLFGPKCECPPELREISNDIIRKCGGLPLAIVTIAGLLASKSVLQEQWDHVNNFLGYSLITNPTWEGMKQVFNLSYNNLPLHLKACMLYMSIYQENSTIWKDDLVNQWIAEGFIWATEGQDKQEISGAYFDELLSRKMIQPVDIKDDGQVLSCVVHHVVLNHISACKSIEENFVTAIHHSQTTTILADKVRRLSLHFGNAEDAMPPTNMRLSQVRTLAFFGVFKCMPSITEFRLLQVLILHLWGDKDSISLDLTRISELFRLRYLKVTSNVTLELQTQMRGLQHLETIKIDARVSSIPSEIAHLPGLLHLSLTAETGLPNGMGHMTSLRTLGYFDLCGSSMENVWSLSKLTNLRDLQLTCSTIQLDNLNYKMQHLLGSILGRLNNLKSLTLVPTASYYANSLDNADATGMSISGYGFSIASSPLILLQRLKFSPRICVFSCLPMFIRQLSNLCILKIGVREIVGDDVDVLRGLPVLCVLSLYVHTKPAERIVIAKAGFWALKYFKFKCCDPRLKFDADGMRNLRILKLHFNAPGADQRSRIPVGIENLSSLKEVSAEIGGAGPEESDRRAAELAFRDAMRVHPRCPRVTVKCVNQIFGCKEDHSSMTREEEYRALKQSKIPQEVSADKIMEDPGQESIKHADSRFTLSEWHMLLLLRNKLDNQHDDITGRIPVFDPYSMDPWKLAENGAGPLLMQDPQLFFRPLEEARDDRPRQASSGYWEAATGSAGYIYSAEGLSIGLKRTMEFYQGCKPSGIKTRWKMEEFTAFQKPTAGATDTRLTLRSKMSLCQLYIEPATISAGNAGSNPSGLLKAEEHGALRQYGSLKDEPTEKDEIIQNVYGKNPKDEPTEKSEIIQAVYGENLKGEPTEKDEIVQNVYGEKMNIQADITVCAGCKTPTGQGRFLICMDSVWHPQCFRCYACDKPISEYEFAMQEDHAYHGSCYKSLFHPKCDVCKTFIPTNTIGLVEYRAHPFWMQKYCPSHENDGTPRCCSCERMEPKDSEYITLDDGRRLCLECLHTAVMNTDECQPLYIDIQEFYEGMNMKVEQQIPLLLVERQALNEAMEAEKMGHHLPETRGLCLSEEQIVRTILRRPIIGPGNKIIDMITGPYKLVRRCEVTAILILYGLPRLLTGSILAHEMMHAYLRLKGYRMPSPEVEEGICQVLAHLWLESEITSGSGSMATTSAASSSSSTSSSKKGAKTDFEKKLGEFFKHQIETDPSVAYGDGFRAGIQAVEQYGLRSTLDHIKLTGSFP